MTQQALHDKAHEYKARSPEHTVLYKAVANHVRSFFALAENGGKNLPKHVKKEFEEFLRCGILAYGFLRLKCDGCSSERILAFSCKLRGFCTSCGGRRMSESAAHLVDEVFPKGVGVRQWVVSFPFPIRFLLARSPKLQSKVLEISLRAINALIQKKVRRPGLKIKGGAVTILQRFGGSLNLNLHMHILALEGGYYETPEGPKFWWIEAPSDEEIKDLVKTLAYRVIRYLKKQGHFADDQESVVEADSDDILPELQAASVKNKVALGERKGQGIRRIGSLGDMGVPELTGHLCANIQGFSLHAGVYCPPDDRKKLEHVCRYIARPAVAEKRLSLLSNQNVMLKLKKPYSDGTTHLVFSPIEFLEKLAALVPPPRSHLTRFHGVLAPHSKVRAKIVPKAQEKQAKEESEVPAKKSNRISWAKLLKRVFSIDVEKCQHCGGKLKIVAAIMETVTIEKILRHLGMPHKPPEIARSRYYTQEPLFD
jgi:Putative transposase/Transposase zinc-binding domain